MAITLAEAIITLTNGKSLTWETSGSHKGGTIHLQEKGQRRLFEFMTNADPDDVASASELLFDGLTVAWQNNEYDPANTENPDKSVLASGPWRLKRIEAIGFGGLNTPDGPAFELEVGGENWCLEGYNGSGKTSLASLILWTLTGYRNREQDGPLKDLGYREVVKNDTAKKVGTWPPLVTYPSTLEGLKETAHVTATLTFTDPTGSTVTATRKVESPVDSDPIVTAEIDPRLLQFPELIETGLLMPARIGHIGFGSKSQSLYQALKMLTGLDQLAAIGIGAAGFGHGAKRFLKYARDNNISGLETEYSTCLERARENSETTSIDLAQDYSLGSKDLIADLSAIETDASTKAGVALTLLETEIANGIDVGNPVDRDQLNKAVNKARVYVSEGVKGISLFNAWGALKKAGDVGFSDVKNAIQDAETSLTEAVEWHARQIEDEKLRLKALASQFYTPTNLLDKESNCPLCETKLTSEQQLTLAKELAALKEHSEEAERVISDACSDITKALESHLPKFLETYFLELSQMDPAQSFANSIKARFHDGQPFSDILTGIGNFVSKYANEKANSLPEFTHKALEYDHNDIPEVKILQTFIANFNRVSALTAWWTSNRTEFVTAWTELLGIPNEKSEWPADSLEGKLKTLEDAIAGSDPLDKIAQQMKKAKKAAKSWAKINAVQKTREDITEALDPLRLLQKLVDCETNRTVVTLSDRVNEVLDDIRLKDRFSFQNTAMGKKSVTVEGSYAEGMKIDASLVANSSWLRSLLWAFIFALREQAIADAGNNLFPLMVLDDPQTTFDPKNKRKWAKKITDLANIDITDANGMQLFLTTHERQFNDIICETCELIGQQGKMAGPTSSSKVAHIVNGTFLDRQFRKASENEDDEEGYRYVQQVRVYCEDLLKIMLRPESYEITGDTLGKLCELLAKLHADHVEPFNRSIFQKLIGFLSEKNAAVMKVINASHHTYDGTIGYAEAEDVQKYWKEKLQRGFMNAFRLAADYDAYGGVSRLFAWEDNVIDFPNGHSDKIKALKFISSGVAAAAETDGMIGDGQIKIEEWEQPAPITLFKHSAYRLNAGTLDPVAGIGDIILVQDFGQPRSRNLIVVAFGNRLYARRMSEADDHPDVVLLTAQATDPYALPDPIIALKDKIEPKKIVGTLFMAQSMSPPKYDENEVSKIDDFVQIETRLKDVKLFKVKGRSMEPIALEDQYVMTTDEALDYTTLKRLNGELVIAVDENAGVYFKRLRLHGKHIVLESANSSVTTSSEILSLEDVSDYPKLTSLKSVVGVLFDLPNPA